jgi:hypothetical protein
LTTLFGITSYKFSSNLGIHKKDHWTASIYVVRNKVIGNSFFFTFKMNFNKLSVDISTIKNTPVDTMVRKKKEITKVKFYWEKN